MDNTVAKVSHSACTGCGACLNRCPVNAITMEPDGDGYIYPVISEKCIHCGLCEKSCPVLKPLYKNNSEPDCYAMWAEDEIREQSSSGGAFSVLADWALEQKGAVAGAAYTPDCYGVQHRVIDCKQDLAALRGSKYVQSEIGLSYREIEKRLKTGQTVLFTGCPCQVAGLYGYLGKDWENLYTVDLVCHGVPPQSFLEKFVKEKEAEYGSKASKISFRDKKISPWNGYKTHILFQNGFEYNPKRSECAWMRSFFNLLSVRESCGHCKFAKLPRQGDLTVADFWDIHRYNPELDDKKGTSLILVNNSKGNTMLKVLQSKGKMCKPAPLEHGIKYNAQIKYSSILSPKRERFLQLMSQYGYSFEKAVDYALNDRYDIAYVGWWYGKNYGSALTSYALNRYLTNQGKTVLMLEYPTMNGPAPQEKPQGAVRDFANHFYEQSPCTKLDDFRKYNEQCDAFLTGSDQLWNWYSNRDVNTYYFFLDFADKWHKKVAYSTSFGHDYVAYPEEMRLRVGYCLSRFQKISVREESAVTVCKRDFGVDAVQTIDPVFLCPVEEYGKAIALSKVNLNTEQEYILAYILDPTPEKKKIIQYVAEQKGLPYYIILDGQNDFEIVSQKMDDADHILKNVRVEDWLNYFAHASFVITDSFHGFCYSIVFEKSLIALPNAVRGLARFNSLAKLSGLENVLAYSFDEILEHKLWEKQVDYAVVKKRMKPMIDFSKKWLDEALCERKLPPSVHELQLWKCMEHDDKIYKQQETIVHLNDQLAQMQGQMDDMRHQIEILSESKLHWLKRKTKGGIQCLKDNGVLYTIKRVGQKVKNKLR